MEKVSNALINVMAVAKTTLIEARRPSTFATGFLAISIGAYGGGDLAVDEAIANRGAVERASVIFATCLVHNAIYITVLFGFIAVPLVRWQHRHLRRGIIERIPMTAQAETV
ncbi:hypothetical protein PISL3812_02272 [Talaromyces islandicus]|uniref:Uncharacterized protein n=1 Tax=Talaromyces islandicus TaxID=28573 RepID=A0A0U1LPF8_TALIS|nr:hypothetical protein PISL3812_02272 [Talaromyces islandicus]